MQLSGPDPQKSKNSNLYSLGPISIGDFLWISKNKHISTEKITVLGLHFEDKAPKHTTHHGHVEPGADPLLLPRINPAAKTFRPFPGGCDRIISNLTAKLTEYVADSVPQRLFRHRRNAADEARRQVHTSKKRGYAYAAKGTCLPRPHADSQACA